jgi:chromosomal replication initiation ATPase DnaA
MATITYQVIQKPIEERILDAACIYWELDRTYFTKTEERPESTEYYRKSIVYYLIKMNTQYSYREIANKLGYKTHMPVLRSVDMIESHKKIYKQCSSDLNQIQHLADILDADYVTTSISLVNNKIQKTNG